jgi:hypothetical protein
MKKLIVFSSIALFGALISCDKVTNAYPKTGGTSELDWSLYPDGDSAYYASQGLWPTFTANTNTLRNVMIEDFTGHRCNNCPNAANLLHTLEDNNPGRVFGASVHTSPLGISSFQLETSSYPLVLYNDIALEIGTYFGNVAGTSFLGNPHGTVNRTLNGTDNTAGPGQWTTLTNNALASNLKVNIQAQVNYFPTTRGVFLHTEVDKIDNTISNDLGIVVYLIEDSIVGPQLMPTTVTEQNYVHRDVLRGCIDGQAFGRTLSANYLGTNGKYYVNYSYPLPTQYNSDNMHLLIYVYDKVTMEIYQVIEKHI